jgi:cysteinyl-tRNA synthetase
MTTISIYDTGRRRKEVFKPIEPDHVRIYVCGPTVYDSAHIGNARPVVVFDTFVRFLRQFFPRVTYVRNITDIDDKIMAAAAKHGISIAEMTRETTKKYHDDMAALNALPPDHEPRATDFVDGMIELSQTLINKGHAYEADGHVLFDTRSMPDYGNFAKRSRDELIAGARVDVAPYKASPMDFVLWKPSDDGQPGWDSPWGRGRPGWHLECSVMAKALLGETFDIHGGGVDLVFPHHQNEVAQSTCAHDGAALANYWMHNGHLTVGGEKMSKSLGNFITVADVLEDFPGEAIRLTLLSAHYRQPLDFTREAIGDSRRILDRWYRAAADAEPSDTLPVDVVGALADELNTPKAIAVLHALADRAMAGDGEAAAQLRAGAGLLGLLSETAENWFHHSVGNGPSEDEIETLLQQRIAARVEKDFATADRIRDELTAQGIVLEDGPDGTTWRRAG